jgi:hypothetical protein
MAKLNENQVDLPVLVNFGRTNGAGEIGGGHKYEEFKPG